jgi:hypothetical protein
VNAVTSVTALSERRVHLRTSFEMLVAFGVHVTTNDRSSGSNRL